jgi:MoaA/NifB/PqqE/SkfB family radical SAM enzyme
MYHTQTKDWLFTPDGIPRGYIQPQLLKELWFHTGTICNLSCPFCLEGSKPGDNRIEQLTFSDAKNFIDEALDLGVEKFSFTGGEPFIIRDIAKIFEYALEHRPCLVLTNGTKPLRYRLKDILHLLDKPNQLSFRISLDYPDPEKHDESRGKGNFRMALETLSQLHQHGFSVSIARLQTLGENVNEIELAYQQHLSSVGISESLPFVVFPNLFPPGSDNEVPFITQNCMTQYKNEQTRSEFMCNYSKMVVKQGGKMQVYACTLVDDDPFYNLGSTLTEAMEVRVMLKHHRCYACFAHGTSCSEKK